MVAQFSDGAREVGDKAGFVQVVAAHLNNYRGPVRL
jgi:hypothetical protein